MTFVKTGSTHDMTETATHDPTDTESLPETVHLVNEELQNHEVKFHVYVHGSYTESRYSTNTPDCVKPRCGQDGRKQYDESGLITVKTTDLIEHLLPGMCRRCLNYLGLPQPTTDVSGGEIHVTDSEIRITGGETTERVLPETHPYRE